jgi:hypothetical protein
MWEMISNMASDRLWIYTALAGSAFGAAFLFWFKDTKIATWGVQKFDAVLEYLAIRWGWTWLQNDPNAWRTKYPKITAKIDELETRLAEVEKNSHPCKELHEFDVWPELDKRIKKLEGKK